MNTDKYISIHTYLHGKFIRETADGVQSRPLLKNEITGTPDFVKTSKQEEEILIAQAKAPHDHLYIGSLLSQPADSFGGEWMETEIKGLDKQCYQNGGFANRFITFLVTKLVTETATEHTSTESNDVNTVFFKANDNGKGCLPTEVSKYFTSSCT